MVDHYCYYSVLDGVHFAYEAAFCARIYYCCVVLRFAWVLHPYRAPFYWLAPRQDCLQHSARPRGLGGHQLQCQLLPLRMRCLHT